jgi:hypothetical protein
VLSNDLDPDNDALTVTTPSPLASHGLAPSFVEPPRRGSPRSQLQVPLMDDRVPLRRRHLQLGLCLLDKRPLPEAGNLRPRVGQHTQK